ncbi:MAG: hypothetical protein R3E42_19775 [Burkholderiaceae bacterium]
MLEQLTAKLDFPGQRACAFAASAGAGQQHRQRRYAGLYRSGRCASALKQASGMETDAPKRTDARHMSLGTTDPRDPKMRPTVQTQPSQDGNSIGPGPRAGELHGQRHPV